MELLKFFLSQYNPIGIEVLFCGSRRGLFWNTPKISIVTSLNADILTPLLGIFGGTDFSYLTVTLGTGENAPVLHYGNFLTAVINFLITALVIFVLLKVINCITEKLSTFTKNEEEAPVPTTKNCPYCKTEIDIEATRCPHCTSQLDD